MEIRLKTFSLFICLISILSKPPCCQADESKIDPELLTILQSGQSADVIVFFQNGIQPAVTKAEALRSTEPNQMLRYQQFIEALQENSEESQTGVLQLLSGRQDERGADAGFESFNRYWLGNKVYVNSANLETVLAIAEDPQVAKIEEEEFADEIEPQIDIRAKEDPDFDPYWAQKRMQIEEAWEHSGGNKGEGVLIATIDTGVAHEHEALIDNFVGIDYGWYDPVNKQLTPYDDRNHGTHCTGSVVGSKGIGVAPGAKWMTCKAFGLNPSKSEHINACLQFVACPTLPDGTNPDCSKAPQIVSNSWGTRRKSDIYNDAVMALRVLGVIQVFVSGNRGPACDTVRSPGQLPYVMAVGASDINGTMAFFSSNGNAIDGGIKPDFVGPGVDVLSAIPGENGELNKYEPYSGTSMATPLVAGVVTLMKARNPDLTHDEAYDILAKSALRTVVPHERATRDCEEKFVEEYPNKFVGYGFINALKVLERQTESMKKRK